MTATPLRPLLIIEGAGCAQLAAAILPDYECLDFASLPDPATTAERDLQFWVLNPTASLKAIAKYVKHARSVALINTRDKPGISFADVLGTHQHGDAIVDFIKARLTPVEPPKSHTKKLNGHARVQSSAIVSWQALGLECNAGGIPHAYEANVVNVLSHHEITAGKIWYDRFRDEVYHDFSGEPKPWTDRDARDLLLWMQSDLKLVKFKRSMIDEGVLMYAMRHERNSVVDWLESLHWDKHPRLNTWLLNCLGVPLNAYSEAVGRNWLIAMVARAYRPGCQVDHMPILEGAMGRGKSSFLRLLGGDWYSALPDAFGSKDFLQGIHARWLIEVPDLAGFNRREHQHILAIITTPIDRYRKSYGHHTEDHPRQCIFTATSESDEYLQAARGRRRFWPLRCNNIDLDELRDCRSQLFAEAVGLYKRGATWHEVPEEDADSQQLERVEEDTWNEQILTYVEGRRVDQFGGRIAPTLTSTGILSMLGVALPEQHDGLKRRIKTVMEAAGWRQKVDKVQGHSFRKWTRQA